jgi:hypothetical protein
MIGNLESAMDGSTALFTLQWLRGWPVEVAMPMATLRVAGGTLSLIALLDGSINIQIVTATGERGEVTSIPVTLKSTLIKIGAAWKLPEDISVFANGIHIASLLPAELPASADLPIPISRKAIDFSVANAEAIAKRQEKERSRTARVGRRLRTADEEVKFLIAANRQLHQLADAIDRGDDYHFHGAIALIRSLIARGRGGNFQPLVQRIAGRLNSPLLLYAGLFAEDPIADASPSLDIRLDVTPDRENGDEAEIDLDVWLQTPGLIRDTGVVLTQNDVIRLLSDTAGSHFDPDASAEFDEIEEITIYRGGIPTSIMVAYASRLAKCVYSLTDKLIKNSAIPG